MDICNVLHTLVLREKKSSKPAKTVIVLLNSEVVWQQVPDHRTHHSEELMADCGKPVSWYDKLQATGRPQALPTTA